MLPTSTVSWSKLFHLLTTLREKSISPNILNTLFFSILHVVYVQKFHSTDEEAVNWLELQRLPPIENRGQTDRSRYHAHTRWTLPLSLSTAARCASRRASAQRDNHHCGRKSILNPWPWPWARPWLSIPCELVSLPTILVQKLKVTGQSVQKIQWKQMDGRTKRQPHERCLWTLGLYTYCFTLPANVVDNKRPGKHSRNEWNDTRATFDPPCTVRTVYGRRLRGLVSIVAAATVAARPVRWKIIKPVSDRIRRIRYNPSPSQ